MRGRLSAPAPESALRSRERSPPGCSSSSPEQEGSRSRRASPSGLGPRSATSRGAVAHPSQPRPLVGCKPPPPHAWPRLLAIGAKEGGSSPAQAPTKARRFLRSREREGVGRTQHALVLPLVASDPLRVGRAFFLHPSELCKRLGCTSSAPLLRASTPRLAYKQKEKGEGPEESRSPPCRAGLAPPAALHTVGFIRGVQA